MSNSNRQWRLAARPKGMVQPSDFRRTVEPVPAPADGQALVRVEYLSLDPAMRGWMNEGKSYVPPVGIGEVMRALGIGRVIASRDASLKEGDVVTGVVGVQEYAALAARELTRVDERLAPLPRWLGALGMPGMTAYFGLLDVGQPRAGETVVVSGAAGAVGSLVGQIARIKGCRVVGIAGGEAKCRYLVEELGFDGAIDYKLKEVRARLKELCPRGIDVYFDNVGGEILDVALGLLARKARVVICGAISQYNNAAGPVGPKNYLSLLVNRARMEGFVVFDYAGRYAGAASELAGWLSDGKLTTREDVEVGLDRFPEVLLKLFTGENAGKLVLEVDHV